MNSIKNILYLGWLGQGNVGDDILFELFKTQIQTNTKENMTINVDTYPMQAHYEIDLARYHLVVLGGGSLLHLPHWMTICSKAMASGIPVISWGTGIDGFYQDEASLSQTANNLIHYQHIYQQFTQLYVRGPYTKEIIQQVGRQKDIQIIGDPALFYPQHYEDIQAQRNRHILINWGTAHNHLTLNQMFQLENELVKTIHYLLDSNYTITVYPMWTADIKAVNQLVHKINHPQCQALSKVYEGRLLIKLIQQSEATINLKLHASILSAAANKPFISLAYGGKCFDFSASINHLPYTINANHVDNDEIMTRFHSLQENYTSVIKQFHHYKTHYYPRLTESIHSIIELLYK